jgi:HTH-type transcriptional regulator, sugar sensing transcriptional regulator
MNLEILKEIGLTDGEIKVYIALIKLGSSSTGAIIKEAKVHSSKVYPILDRLIDKGLVSYIKEGKKAVYTANPANSILSYIEKKQSKLDNQKKEAKDVMAYLTTLNKTHADTEATLFRGKKGLKAAYELATKDLKAKDEVYEMFIPPVEKSLSSYFINFVKQLSEKKVIQYMLFDEPCRESEGVKNFKNVKLKVGASPDYSSPAEICVYGDNVIIASSGVDEIITVLIKNKTIADSFKQQFKIIWQQDVVVSHGLDALMNAHEKSYLKLKPGEEYVYLGIPKHQPKEHHDYWKKDHERRIKSKIKCRLLFNQDTEKKILVSRNKYKDCDARYMPTDIKTPSYMAIFKDTVMMALPKKEPIVVEINNKEIADSFKSYFEAFWKLSQKEK